MEREQAIFSYNRATKKTIVYLKYVIGMPYGLRYIRRHPFLNCNNTICEKLGLVEHFGC